MLRSRRRPSRGSLAALLACTVCALGLAARPAATQEARTGGAPDSAPAQESAWLWTRQVELWVGEESAAFGGVDLAFIRTELEDGYQLSFALSQPHRDWSVGNARVIDIEHDQAAVFDGLKVTLRPSDMGPRWILDVDGPLLEGFRQNAAQSAESARVAGRFPEFARHINLAMERRLSNLNTAGKYAASWLQATRLVGPRPDLPRVDQPYWIGDPLLERDVFGPAGAWLSITAPPVDPEASGDAVPPAPGSVLETGRALLTPESLERYVAVQREGGWTTEVGGAFEWSLAEPDESGRRSVRCRTTFQEGEQRWSLVDSFTPLPLNDPQFAGLRGRAAQGSAATPAGTDPQR